MGRSPCCDKIGLKKGPWTTEEDDKLLAYIQENGHGSWRSLPLKAGLQRCGKSCRLRWTNYLRPDIKRGKFSLQEEQTIIQLHALLGNRWSAIATHLDKRTDNEIKNYWNTHLKKRLENMGIDPITHKPKNGSLLTGSSKSSANLSHMAQWESARLEAEARLVKQTKVLPSAAPDNSIQAQNSESNALKSWSGRAWAKTSSDGLSMSEMESPKSTISSAAGIGETSAAFLELVGEGRIMEEEREKGSQSCLAALRDDENDNPTIQFPTGMDEPPPFSMEWASESILGHASEHVPCGNFVETFTDLLLSTSNCGEDECGESDNNIGSGGGDSDCCEGNKNYWDNILNLVNCSPSDPLIF